MSIGIVDDDAFEQELARLSGKRVSSTHARVDVVPLDVLPLDVVPLDVLPLDVPGRKEGDVNVPDSLRQIIGEDSVINGRQSALGIAKMFGISPSSVSAYAKGATSTTSYDSPKPSIISHINKSRRRAVKKAQETLNQSLSAITQEKLDYTDAKDLSGIAKDMSVIIKNLEPPQLAAPPGETNQSPQFVIFAPQFRDERSFDSIVVNE